MKFQHSVHEGFLTGILQLTTPAEVSALMAEHWVFQTGSLRRV